MIKYCEKIGSKRQEQPPIAHCVLMKMCLRGNQLKQITMLVKKVTISKLAYILSIYASVFRLRYFPLSHLKLMKHEFKVTVAEFDNMQN